MSNVYRLKNIREEKQKVISLKPIEKATPTINNDEENVLDEEQSLQAKEEANKLIEQAKEEAEQIIKRAENEIALMKEKLEEEKMAVLQQAKEDGYNEGHQIGMMEAESQYEKLIDQAIDIVNSTKLDYKNKLRHAEKDILTASIVAAEKITKQQIKEDPSAFVNIINEVLEEVIEQPEISIYVHPASFDLVKEHQLELESMLPETSNLYIYPKKELHEFGCHIESPFGVIDCSVDTKLELLKEELLKMFERIEADELDRNH